MLTSQIEVDQITLEEPTSKATAGIKWPEVFSLGALNAAVAISWIAYQEYQPVLLQRFQVNHLAIFLVLAKAIILVLVPIIAGYLADRILANRGKYFIVYMVGISTTAMIFMIVASIIAVGPDNLFAQFLPIMIVLWLISMGIYISPATSMIETFASKQNLPIVMGVIILITEIIYSLEPLVVMLVDFFGDTLTFIVGGILVLGTGLIFNKITSNEVFERKEHVGRDIKENKNTSSLLPIIWIGLLVGLGRAFLVEYIPFNSPLSFATGQEWSFLMLGLSAIVAFGFSRYVAQKGTGIILPASILVMIAGIILLTLSVSYSPLYIVASLVVGSAFGMANVCGLPYAFGKLSARQITSGIGIFLGAAAVAEGMFEVYNTL